MIHTFISSQAMRLAFKILRLAMKHSEGYAWSWQCNLACAAMDNGVSHERANRAAATFMQRLFDVDMTATPMFQVLEDQWRKFGADMTLQDYLVHKANNGAIDFVVRASTPDASRFYIRPQDRSGITVDFALDRNVLTTRIVTGE